MSPALADSLPLSHQSSPTVHFRWANYVLCEFYLNRASQMIQWTKNLPAMQELQAMLVRSLGQEDPLEEEVAIYSSILAWKIPWTEEPGGLQSMGLQKRQTGLSD